VDVKLAMMVHESYDGIALCRSDNGLKVRVMRGDVVPLDWVKGADGRLLGNYFVELPGCFGDGYVACGCKGLMARKCDEEFNKRFEKEKERTRNNIAKEEVMGEDKRFVRNESSKTFTVDIFPGGIVSDDCGVTTGVGVIPDAFKRVKGKFYTEGQVRALEDESSCIANQMNGKVVEAFKQVQKLLNDKVPDIMQHAEGDVVKAVGLLLNGLVSSITTSKSLMADLRGIEDRKDGPEDGYKDGTFMSRDEGVATGVIRRVKSKGVGCDDQSGEDVCQDAGGAREWMK